VTRLAAFVLVATLTACISRAGSTTASQCDRDFADAAAIDPSRDSVEDLDPAVRDCQTLDEWKAAAQAHPDALDGADPIVFLSNRCLYGPKEAALCKQVPQ
jgi:hypothetical protein